MLNESNTLSSLLKPAEDKSKIINNLLEEKRAKFKILTPLEIVYAIEKAVKQGKSFTLFFNAKITDEDLKTLRDKNYHVIIRNFSNPLYPDNYIAISWTDVFLKKS